MKLDPLRRPLTVLLLAAGALASCPGALFAVPTRNPLAALPAPDLSDMESSVRQRVETLRERVEQASKSADLGSDELAEGYGRLGQYYLAFDFFEAAAVCFANALQLTPGELRWTYYLGVIEQAAGRLEEASTHFRAVLQQSPKDPATLVRLGQALAGLGENEPAARAFEQAAELDASRAAGRFGLGKLAAKAGRHKEAVEHYEAVRQLAPEASIVHYSLGQAYRRLGDLDRARAELARRGTAEVPYEDPLGNEVAWLKTGTAFEVLQALARQSSDQFSDRDFLGFALTQLRGVEGAAEKLEEVLRLRGAPEGEAEKRESARVHYVLGGLLVDRGADLRALEHFQTAVGLDPSLLDAGIKLGNVLARQDRFEDAAAAYSAVLAQDGNYSAALLKRAALRMSQRQFEGAIADLEKLSTLDPETGEVWIRLATSHQLNGDLAAAESTFARSLEVALTTPERVGALYELGNLAARRGQLEAAIGRYREALSLEPASPRVSFSLAGVLGQLGQFDQAVEQYQAVTAADPSNAPAWRGVATALVFAGRHGEARQALEAGLAEIPESLDLKHALARLLAASPDLALRDGERAFELAIEVFNQVPTFEHGQTVAMALAQAGRFEEAVRMQQGLLDQAEQRGDSQAASVTRQHLDLYRAGRACCG